MVYLTKDEFGYRQGYADWDAYAADNAFPTEAGIDDMIEDMSALMNEEIGQASDVTVRLTELRNICYRGVLMMIDEELARDQGERRAIYNPADYMHERDRVRLRSIGYRAGARKVAKWVF